MDTDPGVSRKGVGVKARGAGCGAGASGQFGHAAASQLLDRGEEVIALSRSTDRLADLAARAKTQRVIPRRSGSVARKVETKREKAMRTPPERAADPCSCRKLTRLARAGCGSAPLDNPGQSVWYLHIRILLFEKYSRF